MSIFFEILPGTDEYDLAWNIFHFHEKWLQKDVKQELENKLGFNPYGNVMLWPYRLTVSSSKYVDLVNAGYKDEFMKNPNRDGTFEAKKRSEFNEKFLEVVDKYGLEYYDPVFLMSKLGLHLPIKSKIHMLSADEERYFIEVVNPNVFNSLDSTHGYSNHSSLKKIENHEFYRLKSIDEEMKEKEQEQKQKQEVAQ